MRVHEWMSPDPMDVQPSDSVRQARRMMRQYGIRHLPVTDGGRVVGMLSDRDVRIDDDVLDKIALATDEDSDEFDVVTGAARQVRLVMSSPVHVISPGEDIEQAARMMLSWRVSALPVVEADGQLVGVITTTDCLLAMLRPIPVNGAAT